MENKSECTRYSYQKDGVSYNIKVEKISNGYLVCMEKSYYEGEGEKKEWKYEETKTYYEKNPLEEKENKEEKKEDSNSVIKGLNSFMEKMNPLLNM